MVRGVFKRIVRLALQPDWTVSKGVTESTPLVSER